MLDLRGEIDTYVTIGASFLLLNPLKRDTQISSQMQCRDSRTPVLSFS